MMKPRRISVFRTVRFKDAEIIRLDGEVVIARENISLPKRPLPPGPKNG